MKYRPNHTTKWMECRQTQQIGALNSKLVELYFVLSSILCNLQAWGMANTEHQATPKRCTQYDLSLLQNNAVDVAASKE
jgi:hypothetical protein